MNFSNPRSLAFANSLLLSIVLMGILFALHLLFKIEINWFVIFIMGTSMFLISLMILRYSLEKFIYKKIKIIYKTISTLKADKTDKNKAKAFKTQTIESVNKDVMQWAQEKKEEIEQLKKMQAYRQEFLGNISHEMKTPIFNIQGYVLTLLDGGLDDSQINRKYLLRTEKSINRMTAIIEDLEAISRLESGELQLEWEKIELIELTKEIIELFEIKAKRKNIEIYLAKSYEKPIFINADKESLRQILTNLIVNSIKYGKDDGKTKISFFDMDENILIEVTDDGIGIDKEKIPRLFERFYRVDKSRSREQGGSGLGLSIVKHLIEAHNQSINVRSTPGIGSTFAFTMKKA